MKVPAYQYNNNKEVPKRPLPFFLSHRFLRRVTNKEKGNEQQKKKLLTASELSTNGSLSSYPAPTSIKSFSEEREQQQRKIREEREAKKKKTRWWRNHMTTRKMFSFPFFFIFFFFHFFFTFPFFRYFIAWYNRLVLYSKSKSTFFPRKRISRKARATFVGRKYSEQTQGIKVQPHTQFATKKSGRDSLRYFSAVEKRKGKS